jgi:hypothetical protein
MVCNIGPRAGAQIELLQAAEQITHRTRQRPIAGVETLLAQ